MKDEFVKDADVLTLGDKLSVQAAPKQDWLRHIVYVGLNACVWGVLMAQILWMVVNGGDGGIWLGLAACAVMWCVLSFWGLPRERRTPKAPHFLLAHDKQQFMAQLRLDAKTAVFDGSNIYHFGLRENAGADAARLIVQRLRTDGYRIVCFFDANIFYTLVENGDFASGQSHELSVLMDVFGLQRDEIYVVPSLQQADKFILSTLTHLPISFAVSNDQFRDYAKAYKSVMKGDQWRKGVSVKDGELRLYKYGFQTPVRLSHAAR